MDNSFKFDGDVLDFSNYNKGPWMSNPFPGAAADDFITFDAYAKRNDACK